MSFTDRAGRTGLARTLLEERLDRRPNGRDSRWLVRMNGERAAAAAGG